MSFAAKNQTNPAVVYATGHAPYAEARASAGPGGARREYWERRGRLDELRRHTAQHCRDLFRNRWELEAGRRGLYSRVRWDADRLAARMDEDLERRRSRLGEVLRSEEAEFAEELRRGALESPGARRGRMLGRYEALRARREAERRREAEERREQHFRRNCDELRQQVRERAARDAAEEGRRLRREAESDASAARGEEDRMYAELWRRDGEAKRQKAEAEEEHRRRREARAAEEVAEQIARRELEKRERRTEVETEAALMEEHSRLLELEELGRRETKMRRQVELKAGLDACLRAKLEAESRDVQDDVLQDLFFAGQIAEDREEAEREEKKRALLREQREYLRHLEAEAARGVASEAVAERMRRGELEAGWEREDRERDEERARSRRREEEVVAEVKAQIETHMSKARQLRDASRLHGQKVREEDAADRDKAAEKLRLVRKRNLAHQKELLEQIRDKEAELEREALRREAEAERTRTGREEEEEKVRRLLAEMKIDNEHPYRARRREIRGDAPCDC